MQIDLSTGTLDYLDTGGNGPTVVLLHGLLMDGSLWDGPVADLAADHRCVVPTLPLGAHRHPMPGSDRSASSRIGCRCATTPTCRCPASPGCSRSSSTA